MATTLAATYTGPSSDGLETPILIKQDAWSLYTHRITNGRVIRLLRAIVESEEYKVDMDCGIEGGVLVCPVRAYPKVAGIDYTLLASWGELSERVVEMAEISEQVQFRLASVASTEFPPRQILSAEWTLHCLDRDGNPISAPALVIDDQEIKTSNGQEVYGTSTVRYLCEIHHYILNAPRRDDALDNNFSAVLVAPVIGYQPAYLVVDMPPGIDEFEADADATCGGSTMASMINQDEDLDIPEPSTADKYTEVDYCPQTIIREWTQ